MILTAYVEQDPTVRVLLRTVYRCPRDRAPRLILADRLEDLGDWKTAEAVRWQVAERRLSEVEYHCVGFPGDIGRSYRWASSGRAVIVNKKGITYPLCRLPPDLWCLLDGYVYKVMSMSAYHLSTSNTMMYSTHSEADLALWRGYVKWKKLS